jgi:peptidoglycan hydrolase CwlO-like protein/surface antigen
MKRQEQQITFVSLVRRNVPMLIISSIIVVTCGMFTQFVHADTVSQLQAQVDSLSAQNAQNQQAVSGLQLQAQSYQNMINQLSSQIASLQSQIANNRAKQAQLDTQIQEKEQELIQQKSALGEDLKAMYVSGQMSTVEMLATSKNLSDYVDAATYSSAVQNKIQDTLNQITNLENQLKDQQSQVEQLLVTLNAQQKDVTSKQVQQDHLLAMNQSQQATYNAQITANQSQISALQQQIIAANLPKSGNVYYGTACDSSHGDTYPSPLCNSPQDSLIDQWGLYNRECVSYVAWKEYSNGKMVPYGLGNAGDWPSNVPRGWVTSTPQAGDAAVRPAISGYGFWEGGQWVADVGHVMYIEHVNSDGTIAVSQYNASLNGEYSYVPNRSTAGLVFIHFPAQ